MHLKTSNKKIKIVSKQKTTDFAVKARLGDNKQRRKIYPFGVQKGTFYRLFCHILQNT